MDKLIGWVMGYLFLPATRILSTKFGYGRPAFFAVLFADAFCDGVSFSLLPSAFGRALSHTCFMVTPLP